MKNANDLTRSIIDFLRNEGWQAERISVTGRQTRTGRRIKSTMTPGSADISATIQGRSVKIEVKIGRDSQSTAQVEYQHQVEGAGGVYSIARTWEEFLGWYYKSFRDAVCRP